MSVPLSLSESPLVFHDGVLRQSVPGSSLHGFPLGPENLQACEPRINIHFISNMRPGRVGHGRAGDREGQLEVPLGIVVGL